MGKSVVEMVNNRCGIDDNNEGGRDGLEAHKSMVSQKVQMLRGMQLLLAMTQEQRVLGLSMVGGKGIHGRAMLGL